MKREARVFAMGMCLMAMVLGFSGCKKDGSADAVASAAAGASSAASAGWVPQKHDKLAW